MNKKVHVPQSENLNKKTRELNQNLAESARLQREKALDAELNKIANQKKMAMEAASYGISGQKQRQRDKILLEQQKLEYQNNTAKNAFVSVVTDLVIESLMIDLDKYSELNPNYKGMINDVVGSLVEATGIPLAKRREVSTILESINNNIPAVEVGIYMEAEEVIDIIKDVDNEEVKSAIKKLSIDVKDKVIDIVKKDAEGVENFDAEIADVQGAAGDNAQFAQDATAINVVETLALNEASNMIARGEEYNADLALANAITLVTVLESLQAMEVTNLSEVDYKELVREFSF